ncbi:MAG: hypothetical protein KKA73_28190 [Chloroflexi bacterium]|nr:hypothetical protein [Chloroflexota bacterium]MBU1751575.1 hypothetical protein [Chloroflexota bacterium]MBU1879774.1 hypothetical protein [Chloroflexota bacterium]
MDPNRAQRLGLSNAGATLLAGLSDEEALPQRCVDCEAVIQRHSDARWRFQLHVIRCADCATQARAAGYDEWESLYVH